MNPIARYPEEDDGMVATLPMRHSTASWWWLVPALLAAAAVVFVS